MKDFSLQHNSEGTIISTSSAKTSKVLRHGYAVGDYTVDVLGSFVIDFSALPNIFCRHKGNNRYSFLLLKKRLDSDFLVKDKSFLDKYGNAVFGIEYIKEEPVDDHQYNERDISNVGYFSIKTREVYLDSLIFGWWSGISNEGWNLRKELISNAINSMLTELILNAGYEQKTKTEPKTEKIICGLSTMARALIDSQIKVHGRVDPDTISYADKACYIYHRKKISMLTDWEKQSVDCLERLYKSYAEQSAWPESYFQWHVKFFGKLTTMDDIQKERDIIAQTRKQKKP